MLDIDTHSKYHNKESLEKLLHILSLAGLGRSSLYRSSHSGGWHLYLFFEQEINSAELRRHLVKLLTLNDFQIAKGALEIFPNPGTNTLGLGLRLPLQPGWAWLDKDTLDVDHYREQLSASKALELFLDALDGDCNSITNYKQLQIHLAQLEQQPKQTQRATEKVPPDTLPDNTASNVIPLRRPENQAQNLPKNQSPLQPKPQPQDRNTAAEHSEFSAFVNRTFGHIPAGMIIENWFRGRQFHIDGLSGPSQRAEAITCLGHYLFYGDPGRQLPALGYGHESDRSAIIHEFLAARHNGHSAELNRGTGDALAQIDRATNWRPQHKKNAAPVAPSTEVPIAWRLENAKRQSGARTRIATALATIKESQNSFTTVELQQAAGCSRQTLYKHSDIWRSDYYLLAEDFFATCTDEYNVVEEFSVLLSSTGEAATQFLLASEDIPSPSVCLNATFRSIDTHPSVSADAASSEQSLSGSLPLLEYLENISSIDQICTQGSNLGFETHPSNFVLDALIDSETCNHKHAEEMTLHFPQDLESKILQSISILPDDPQLASHFSRKSQTLPFQDFSSRVNNDLIDLPPIRCHQKQAHLTSPLPKRHRRIPLHGRLLLSLLYLIKSVALILLLIFCTLLRPVLNPWSWRYLNHRRRTRAHFNSLDLHFP